VLLLVPAELERLLVVELVVGDLRALRLPLPPRTKLGLYGGRA
jgi:hypothetical protein